MKVHLIDRTRCTSSVWKTCCGLDIVMGIVVYTTDRIENVDCKNCRKVIIAKIEKWTWREEVKE